MENGKKKDEQQGKINCCSRDKYNDIRCPQIIKIVITMTLVDIFSVAIGLAVLLTLLGSIALEGLRRRTTKKKKIIPTINSKWQKKEIAA